jgi:hypothetical protein
LLKFPNRPNLLVRATLPDDRHSGPRLGPEASTSFRRMAELHNLFEQNADNQDLPLLGLLSIAPR